MSVEHSAQRRVSGADRSPGGVVVQLTPARPERHEGSRSLRSRAAVVLGSCETSLAVARGLGRAGVRVLLTDGKKDIAFRSRYVSAALCPPPQQGGEPLIAHLERLAAGEAERPVLFTTSDPFILPVSRHRERLSACYELLQSPEDVVEAIVDKYRQAALATCAGVAVPRTLSIASEEDGAALSGFPLPAIVKGREATEWRASISRSMKGFVVTTQAELLDRVRRVTGAGVEALVQELIPGPDRNHFKVCAYIGRSGEPILAFGLRKLRQCPPGAGFGCLVESHRDPALIDLGLRFFEAIGYRGVGSAEFKLDPRDGRLVLIELNPRYWQQAALAERCGMNFALTHYLDLIGAPPAPSRDFRAGVKWVNLHRDLDSFRDYRRQGELSTLGWLRSLRGPLMDSCFAMDDPWPGLYALVSDPLRRLRGRLFGSAALRSEDRERLAAEIAR